MLMLRLKIAYARANVFVFKKAFFLPQKIKDRYAKTLTIYIRSITKEMIERQII